MAVAAAWQAMLEVIVQLGIQKSDDGATLGFGRADDLGRADGHVPAHA